MKEQLPALLESISATQPVMSMGLFRLLHNSYFGRYRFRTDLPEKRTEDWERVAETVAADVSAVDPKLISLAEKHAWLLGHLDLRRLTEQIWPRLTRTARGRLLAGVSEHLEAPEIVGWVTSKQPGCAFDLDSAWEFGCNAIYFNQPEIFRTLLDQCTDLVDQRVDRITPLGQEGESWRKQLEPLPNRLLDVWLEAAVRVVNYDLIRVCLQAGADPNIPIWRLERSFNERNSVLGCIIDEEGSKDGKIEGEALGCIQNLVAMGADPEGREYEGRNLALAKAFERRAWVLADYLLDHGAKFEGGNLKVPQQTAGCESTIWSPGPSLRLSRSEYDWAKQTLGPLIDFAEIETVPYFYNGNAQGGYYTTFLGCLFWDDNLGQLRHFESRGLPTKHTIAVLLSAIGSGAYQCLRYLLKAAPDPDAAFRLIMEHAPEFGTNGRQYMCRPEPDGSNVIPGFQPYGQKPIEMPDGSRFYVSLDSIAAPGHDHGPVPEGNIFVEVVDGKYRREANHLVTISLNRRWRVLPIPGTEGRLIKSAALMEMLPLVKESDGQFFWIGINLGRLWWSNIPEEWKAIVKAWEDGPAGKETLDMADERIKQQDAANLRTPKPLLSKDELDGYPREFWPYLCRLDDGLIGMTETSCAWNPGILDLYRVWERQNKPDATFIPDPRVTSSPLWQLIPVDLRPYFYYDNLFKKPSVLHDGRNDYERAMVRKAVRWNNDLMMQAIREMEQSIGAKEGE